MRLSVLKSDPGYRPDAAKLKAQVLLDGQPIQLVVTADEEQGFVDVYRLERNATTGEERLARSPGGNELRVDRLHGEVRIVGEGLGPLDLRSPKVAVERNLDGRLEVRVYSLRRPGHLRTTTIDEQTLSVLSRRGGQEERLRLAVSVCAGAAAEHLCEAFGDAFDPSEVAKAAEAEYDRLMALEAGRVH